MIYHDSKTYNLLEILSHSLKVTWQNTPLLKFDFCYSVASLKQLSDYGRKQTTMLNSLSLNLCQKP